MKTFYLDKSFSGSWHRDCELRDLKINACPLELTYYRDEDSTDWKLSFDTLVAFKLITEELSVVGFLGDIPSDGAFFELFDSPWLSELKNTGVGFVQNARHFVFFFYDEVIEVVAPNFKVEKI